MSSNDLDESLLLNPVLPMTFERVIEFLNDDDCLGGQSNSICIRKVLLSVLNRPGSPNPVSYDLNQMFSVFWYGV